MVGDAFFVFFKKNCYKKKPKKKPHKPALFMLSTNRVISAYQGDVYDNLTFIPYFLTIGMDYGLTIRTTKTVDALELNAFYRKLDYRPHLMITALAIAIGAAFILPSAILLALSAQRGWIGYNTAHILPQAINDTARRLAKERGLPIATPEDKPSLQASPGPAV